MAQIYNPWQDEKDKQKQQVGTFTTGAGSMNQQPTAAQQKTETQQKPQGSGLFTDIQKFAQQNQGLGQQLGANIQKQTAQAGDQFSGIRDSFQKNQQELAGKFNQGTQFQQQLQQDPTQIAQNQEQLNLFRQLAQGKLGGDIQGLQQYGQQAGQIQQQIGQKLQDVGTEQGRFGLLKDMFGGKKYGQSYGQGQQVLDQALLQTQAGDLTQQVNLAKQQQQDLEQQYGALTGDISTAQETLGTQAQDVSKLLSGELTTQDKALREAQEAEKLQLQETLPKDYQTFVDNANKGIYDIETMKKLGLYDWLIKNNEASPKNLVNLIQKPTRPDQAMGLYGTDLGQYIRGTSSEEIAGRDWSQFLDENEAARMTALSKLSIDPEIGMSATEYKAGEKIDPFSYTKGINDKKFQEDVFKRRNEYNTKLEEINKAYAKPKAVNLLSTYLGPLIEKGIKGQISKNELKKQLENLAPQLSGGKDGLGGGQRLWSDLYRAVNGKKMVAEHLYGAQSELNSLLKQNKDQITQYQNAIQGLAESYNKNTNFKDYNQIGSSERFKNLFPQKG